MVSLVTPGVVAPPLSPPFHGTTHGGAYQSGTATFPVLVSQLGPQLTFVPWDLASSKVRGRPVFPAVGDVPPPPPPPLVTSTATTAMTTRMATAGAVRRREGP